jgi:hypothetical protein
MARELIEFKAAGRDCTPFVPPGPENWPVAGTPVPAVGFATWSHGGQRMEWSIQDLGAAGEFVGAIGVVITLVYLAYQIRQNTVQLEQNTLAAKAAAQNATNVALRETRTSLFESAETAEIFHHGNANPADLGHIPKLRYRLLMQNITEVMLEIYTQTLATGFAPETWHTQGHTLVERILATPGGKWFWGDFCHNYPADFRSEVDQILKNSSPVHDDRS